MRDSGGKCLNMEKWLKNGQCSRTWTGQFARKLKNHRVQAFRCWEDTRKQKVVAEAELYAAALGASEAKGVQSMMRDLGFAVKPVLNIDAKATEHVLHTRGIGKLKHIDVACL